MTVPTHHGFSGFGEDAPLDLPPLSPLVERQVLDRLLSPDFDAWSTAAARVGHCANPIRVQGTSYSVDRASGEMTATYCTDRDPLGALHLRCGNRREAHCPSCSRLYAADTFHLIRAGVTGGKGVPATVSTAPLVFATLTAPSFGPVHTTHANGARCRPRTGQGASRCGHGVPVGCMTVHADDDPRLGEPICAGCYDYESHVIWQWWAPELWRRFTIAMRRDLARRLAVSPGRTSTKASTSTGRLSLDDVVSVQFAKVAEYQRRGVIHFHALIRLDGPKTKDGFAPAPEHVTTDLLVDSIRAAVAAVRYTAPPAYDVDPGRELAFGTQVDARPVRAGHRPDQDGQSGDTLSGEQVAGYLAKYATKSAGDDHAEPRHVVDQDGTVTRDGSRHLWRIRDTARDLGVIARTRDSRAIEHGTVEDLGLDPYLLLGKWVHMLGFRGHFSTKSRRYSVTLGALRRARRRWQIIAARARETGIPVDLAQIEAQLLADHDDDTTTLVVGRWEFIGTGWQTEGDAALARAAAAHAREYAKHKAQTKRG